MSCNGYHTLDWYYTYPMHPYRPVSIRRPRSEFTLIEYQFVQPALPKQRPSGNDKK